MTKGQKGKQIMLILISSILSCLLVLLVYLIIKSPGKPDPVSDQNGQPVAGSISEKVFVKIGGTEQGMFIIGKNVKDPLLLYIHGGPCFPNYFLIDKYKPGLENNFVVCYWEQRGGGLSYKPDVPIESMNFDRLAADAVEVTHYLCNRFGKEKIYMMAHSGGTPIAVRAATIAPYLYNAYIGIAQISDQKESEKIAYKYITEQYSATANKKMVAKLKKYPVSESDSYIIPFYKSLLRDRTMHELGIGTMHNLKSVFKDIFLPVWGCRAYTLKEKVNIWIAKLSFIKKTKLLDEVISTDISKEFPRLEIPVYFLSGKYDLTVNHDLSKQYLKTIQAPIKGFYTFDESAHSPIYEEPQRLMKILTEDVLNGKTSLADTI